MSFSNRRASMATAAVATLAILAGGGNAWAADPVKVLFVGNSYTFGRVDPVMSYNAGAVHDLTAAFNAYAAQF